MINEFEITEVETDYQDIERVQKPSLVYKYRTWNKGDVFNDNVLLKNQLYLAHPESFVDELDCRIPARYDLLTDKEIETWTEKMLRGEFPQYNEAAIQRDIKHYTPRKITEFRDKDFIEKFNKGEWKSYNSLSGILSVCKQPLNVAMWEMYGAEHSGICYGFATDELIRECKVGGGGDVLYVDELPTVHPFESTLYKATIRVYTKLKHWEFEEEYRIRTFSEDNYQNANRIKTFPDHVLKEVTLGVNFDETQIPVIIETLKAKTYKPLLYKCISKENQLDRIPINY